MPSVCHIVASHGCYSWWVSLSEHISRFCCGSGSFYMHPKTAACLAALEKALLQAARLERRLTRLSKLYPPIYWQLDPDTLCTAKQLFYALQQEKTQLLCAQKASEKN